MEATTKKTDAAHSTNRSTPDIDTGTDMLTSHAAHADEIRALIKRCAGRHEKRTLYLALRSSEHLHERLTAISAEDMGDISAQTIQDLSCHASELHTLVVEEGTSLDSEELYVAGRSLDHLSRRLTDLAS